MLSVLNNVLTADQVSEILAKIGGDDDFEDGRSSAGFRAKLVKDNLQMKRNAPNADAIKQTVLDSLKRHPGFRTATFARSIRPIMISRYKPGMQYGFHVDDPIMGKDRYERTDVAATLFISDPSSYDGGELHLRGPWGTQEVKLPSGSAVVYPASTLHRVNPVTRGERIAAVTWMESFIRDPSKRELLAELDQIRLYLHRQESHSDVSSLAFKTFANLMRMWAEK